MIAESHLSDQELLLAVDGELSARDAGRVQSHLAACWACRGRKEELDAVIGEFMRLQRLNFDKRILAPEGPRALLKARLAELAETQRRSWLHFRLPWAIAAAVFELALVANIASHDWTERQAVHTATVTVPNRVLTPGATILASREEICRESNIKNKAVPAALQRKVFDEYGIRSAALNAYEVDYLITPALGGADDIHNLWPQSYATTVWNAQVKDLLEDRLRDMVCGGQLDLATAQREIATNWIEAYKKYFHTDQPLTVFR